MGGYESKDFDRDGYPGPTDRKYFTTKMEAEYVGYYLGCSMLTKGTTGLGVIQKPLRDKYFAFRKSSDNRLGPEIGIRVNPSGLTLLFPGSHPGEENDGFYELPSIHFIEAVRYVVVKEKDKKYYGGFLPIDEATAANCSKEKLFQQIDKKFNNLTKISHPAMLACVMRRPTGVKAVDCHMIVIPVVEDALQIADMVHRFQDRPPANPDYYRGGGPVHSPRGRPDMYPNPDVIPRHFDQRDVERRDYVQRDPVNRESEDAYAVYRGRGRGLELKQEHFRKSNEFEDRRPGSIDAERNRSFERDRQYNDRGFDERQRNEYNDERNRYYGREDSVETRPREMRTTTGFVERDSFGTEYEFDNAPPPDRRRYGEGRVNSERAPVSPRNVRRPDRHSDTDMRYTERPADVNRGPSWGRDPRDDYPSPRPSGGNDMYNRAPRPGHFSPRGRSPPRADSPPRGHSSPRSRSPAEEEIYSASNLESRMEGDSSGKPVAKVPPHRHAGIRVLPSLPLLGAKNQLKPVSPRPEETPKAPEKPPTYNKDYETFRDEEEEENIYDNASDRKNNFGRQGRIYSDQSQDFSRRSEENNRDASRTKSDGFNYDYNQGNTNRAPNYSSNAAPVKPWSFDEEKEKFMKKDREVWNGGYQSKSTQEFQDRDYSSEYQSDRKPHDAKDAEIANMFSNLRTGNQARSDVDFERSLGYLP